MNPLGYLGLIVLVMFLLVILFIMFISSPEDSNYITGIKKEENEQDEQLRNIYLKREIERVRARDYPTWTPSFPRKKKEE